MDTALSQIRLTATKLTDVLEDLLKPSTREEWHCALAMRLSPAFEAAGAKLPDRIRYSTGWPAGSRQADKAIGQCWFADNSADSTVEIFISPAVGDPIIAAATLVHELVHACLDHSAGHGPRFRKLAVAMGLEGKMTATVPGAALMGVLAKLIDEIGPYPHAALHKGEAADKPKKQTTRMIKIECPECGYTCRASMKWILVGCPTCPCGQLMKADDGDDAESE